MNCAEVYCDAAVGDLQAQGDMSQEQEAQLKLQVEELSETTLAVGESRA